MDDNEVINEAREMLDKLGTNASSWTDEQVAEAVQLVFQALRSFTEVYKQMTMATINIMQNMQSELSKIASQTEEVEDDGS